jgi:hypothetical protein
VRGLLMRIRARLIKCGYVGGLLMRLCARLINAVMWAAY